LTSTTANLLKVTALQKELKDVKVRYPFILKGAAKSSHHYTLSISVVSTIYLLYPPSMRFIRHPFSATLT
jgi:hypothetical protein